MSETVRSTPETLVAGLRELGFTITLAGGDQLRVTPESRLNEGARRWIETHRSELTAELQAEHGESTAKVLELAHERFGPSHPFDPSEHPSTKREAWTRPDKEWFFFSHRCPGGAS